MRIRARAQVQKSPQVFAGVRWMSNKFDKGCQFWYDSTGTYERSGLKPVRSPASDGSTQEWDNQEVRLEKAPIRGPFHFGGAFTRLPCLMLCRMTKKPTLALTGLLACCLSRT